MREIKFRAWHLDHGMLYFDFDTFKLDYHDQYGNIMQYTGLKDKNGKEIYEGDIIGISKDHPLFEVFFSSHYGWKMKNREGGIFNINCEILEIIGNIHQNPELF